jgi:hypothetical protein
MRDNLIHPGDPVVTGRVFRGISGMTLHEAGFDVTINAGPLPWEDMECFGPGSGKIWVIYPGEHIYPMDEKIQVWPH